MLGVIGTILAMGAINEAANISSRKAYPEMNDKKRRTDFDAECARYGIKGQAEEFTVTRINMIAARNHVSPNKYGVLPEDGWMKCRDYVMKYINNPQDLSDFRNAWYDTVEYQLEIQRKKISDPTTNRKVRQYYDSEKRIRSSMKNRENGPTLVLEYKHWHGISKGEQLQRMEELQKDTVWGEICAEPPILRDNPRFPNTYTEVWIIKGEEDDKAESLSTQRYYKNLYTNCCAKLGYNAAL